MPADQDDKTHLSPEEQMRAALRGEPIPSPEKPSDEIKKPEETTPPARARTPMIDRPAGDEPGRPGPRGNPFAVAPPVLGGVDSGAGMGFEFKTRRNR